MSMDKHTTLRLDNTNYELSDNLEYEGVAYPYYKVYCLACGESTYATNGLKFNTLEEAETYGEELFFKWWGLSKWMLIKIEFKIEYNLSGAYEEKVLVRSIIPNKGQY